MLQRTGRERKRKEDGIPLKSSSSFVLLHLVFVLLFIRSGALPISSLSLTPGDFSLSFLSHFIRNFVAATFPDFGRVFCCCPFKIGGAKTLFFSETRKTNIKSGNAARHAIRTELKPPKLNVKRGSNTKIIPRE